MIKSDCAVLISSCDSYADILDAFFETLHIYWPGLEYPIYLSTETIEYNNKHFIINNIHPGDINCSWTERITDALGKIKAKYILLLLDDFFLYNYVNEKKVASCLENIRKDKNNAAFLFYPIFGNYKNCEHDGFLEIVKSKTFVVTAIVAALWSKKQLLKYTKKYKENIWEFEQNATIRSKTKYKKDRFFVTKSNDDNIIFYDFIKYGLFSGKWFKETEKLFERLNIKMDFSKRGFYDEALRGMQNSIIDSFCLNSAIIPNYDLQHDGSSYIKCDDIFYRGKFMQEYDIVGARDVIRWEPCAQWGFGIKNLTFKVFYSDGTAEIINNDLIFGSFVKKDDLFIFNMPSPNIYIPTQRDNIMIKLVITGEIIMPLEEELLKLSYNMETKPINHQFEDLRNKLYKEFLTAEEKLPFVKSDPIAMLNNKAKDNLNIIVKSRKKSFVHNIIVSKNANVIKYRASSSSCFGITDLKVQIINKDGLKSYLNLNSIKKLPECFDGVYPIFENNFWEITVDNSVSNIIISGKIEVPIRNEVLRMALKK